MFYYCTYLYASYKCLIFSIETVEMVTTCLIQNLHIGIDDTFNFSGLYQMPLKRKIPILMKKKILQMKKMTNWNIR